MSIRRSLLIVAGIIAIVLAQMPATLRAQTKSEKSKGKSKEGLRFEVYEDSAKEYRWRLVDGSDKDRKVLATGGQGYKAKADCMHGVKSIQEGAADKLTFETYEDNAKESRWHTKASNGQVVAASAASYKTKADCDKAVESIKKGAAKAPVEEVTDTK